MISSQRVFYYHFNDTLRLFRHVVIIKVGFFIIFSSLKVFGYSIRSERRIYLGKSIQALQNDTSYHDYSVSGSSSQYCSSIPLKLLCLFSSFFFSFQLLPNQYRTHITFNHKIQAKIFTWPDMSFYAR